MLSQFTAGVGDEDVAFESGVSLDGKVEVYLQSVLSAQIKTLADHLARSLKRYPAQLRVGGSGRGDGGDEGEGMVTMRTSRRQCAVTSHIPCHATQR